MYAPWHLTNYIKDNKAYYITDLVNLARRKRIEIIVDYHNFFYQIENLVSKKLELDNKNEFLFLPLGENDYMDNVFVDFHNALKAVGIDLLWVAYNPANSGAEVIEVINENEWYHIVRIYKERISFGILSNNTSLALIKGCNVLMLWMLQLQYKEDILNLPFIDRTVGKIIKVPDELRFPIINHLELIRTLKLNDHDQLLCVALLGGNNYTRKHVYDIARLTNIPFTDVINVARYIQYYKVTTDNILRIPELQDYIKEHPDLEESIKSNLKMPLSGKYIEILEDCDNLTTFVKKGIISGKIDRFCGTIHFGSYVNSFSLECLPEGCRPIMDILGDIRRLTYPYLLNKKLHCVYEYRCSIMDFIPIHVDHSELQADEIKGIPEGLNIFETIWSHNESASLNYVERFGMKKALVLYILRYFYIITKDKNLCLSLQDFKSMFVTVFYHYCRWNKITLNKSFEREIFLRMNICPRVTCLNMITWFMRIYDVAKYICGGALDLTDNFPEPRDLISGSIFLAFYEALNGNGDRGNTLFLNTREDLRQASEEIMRMFEKEFNKIMES